jgi:hypothetical protein
LGFRLEWKLNTIQFLYSKVLAFFEDAGFEVEVKGATSTGPPACFFLRGICRKHNVVVFEVQ